MLAKLRIGPKLLLAPGLVLILLIVTSASAYVGMVRQNASLENLVEVRAARLKTAADVAGDSKYAHANIYQLLAWINGSFAQPRLDALIAQIKARHAAVETQLKALAAVSDAAERPIVEASMASLAAYRKAVLDTIEMAQMDQSIATNSMAKAEMQFVVLTGQLAQLAALEKHLSEQAHADASAEFHTQRATMAAMVLLSIALSMAVTMLVRAAMLRDIRAIADVVVELAAGRLTLGRRNDGRDEIAATSRMLDQTIGNLNQTLRTILASVRSIDLASHEIASGNLDLSTRTEMQAGSLQQTASAAALAVRGGAAVDQAVLTMDTIRASSRKIVEIISVIDSISFQTNILALNAAVEAARAGEQGRGFAVVAAEVRTLAQRSAAAAREIKTLIAASVATIDSGSASVHQAGSSMGDIVASVQQVNEVIGRISAASAEQAHGIAEVNQAVGQMDDVTQQNAALVEQAAAAAESLQDQTVKLSQAVSVFKIDEMAAAPGRSALAHIGAGDAKADAAERRAADSAMRAARRPPAQAGRSRWG